MSTRERRENLRMRPKKMTYVALRPDFSKLGKIQDISMGGLCFHYMAKENQNGDAKHFDIDIFISEDGYYLPSVPCRLVYEKRMRKAVSHPVSLEYRLCGLQFDSLSDEQTGELINYMTHHTSGAV